MKRKKASQIIDAEWRELSPEEAAADRNQNPFRYQKSESPSSLDVQIDDSEPAEEAYQLESQSAVALANVEAEQVPKCIGCGRTKVKLEDISLGPIPLFTCKSCKKIGKGVFSLAKMIFK